MTKKAKHYSILLFCLLGLYSPLSATIGREIVGPWWMQMMLGVLGCPCLLENIWITGASGAICLDVPVGLLALEDASFGFLDKTCTRNVN